MRKFVCMLILFAAAGCGSNIRDNYPQGRIDGSLYREANKVNAARLGGEDKQVAGFFEAPFQSIGRAMSRLFDYLDHDTAGTAARKMVDAVNPDNRRSGILRLSDFDFARRGPSLTVYASMASIDDDYTVKAAALRALNRSRATGYTKIFLRDLDEEQSLVRLQAADALSNIPDATALHALIDHLRNDVSADVRIACADALRNFRDNESATALVDVLDDKNFGVAWQARQSLALICGQDFRYDKKAWIGYLSQHSTSE